MVSQTRISSENVVPKRFSMIVAPMGEHENCEEVLRNLSLVPKIVPKKPFTMDRFEMYEENKVKSCYFYFSTLEKKETLQCLRE
jgi:hypothetical protein